MSLEDSEQLKGRMKFFEKELVENHHIDPNLYVEYDVKRGLRDSAGKGVLTGLTEISDVTGYKLVNGRRIPADGALYYRGIDVQDIVNGLKDRRFGFEETIYLLIFGKLPSKEELSRFLELLSDMEDLGGRPRPERRRAGRCVVLLLPRRRGLHGGGGPASHKHSISPR